MVIYIPNGYSGALAGQAARDIIGFYRDRQKQQENPPLPQPGELVE